MSTSTVSFDRLKHIAFVMEQYGKSKRKDLPSEIKNLTAAAGKALSLSCDHIETIENPTTLPTKEIYSSFRALASRFVSYLMYLKNGKPKPAYRDFFKSLVAKLPMPQFHGRKKSQKDISEALEKIEGYNIQKLAAPIRRRIGQIKQLLKLFQQGMPEDFLAREFSVNVKPFSNYVYQNILKVIKESGEQGLVKAAEKDLIDNAMKPGMKGRRIKKEVKHQDKFYKAARHPVPDPELRRFYLSRVNAVKDYANSEKTSNEILEVYNFNSRQSLMKCIDAWNESRGNPTAFLTWAKNSKTKLEAKKK